MSNSNDDMNEIDLQIATTQRTLRELTAARRKVESLQSRMALEQKQAESAAIRGTTVEQAQLPPQLDAHSEFGVPTPPEGVDWSRSEQIPLDTVTPPPSEPRVSRDMMSQAPPEHHPPVPPPQVYAPPPVPPPYARGKAQAQSAKSAFEQGQVVTRGPVRLDFTRR